MPADFNVALHGEIEEVLYVLDNTRDIDIVRAALTNAFNRIERLTQAQTQVRPDDGPSDRQLVAMMAATIYVSDTVCGAKQSVTIARKILKAVDE